MSHYSLEDESGGFEEADYSTEPYTGETYYSTGHSVVRLDEQGVPHLVSNKETVDAINGFNQNRFKLHLSIIPGDVKQSSGKLYQGAQMNGENISGAGLDLSNLFYCKLQRLTYYESRNKAVYDAPDALGYIIASTSDEARKLQERGYTSVESF